MSRLYACRAIALAISVCVLSACQPMPEETPAEPGPGPAAAPTTTVTGPADSLRQGVSAAGWKLAAEAEVWEGEQIYDYMNGEGEIPVACGYQSLATADITGPSDVGARIELFQMGSDANAFGLYSLRREPADERVALTHPAVLAPGQLIGWKGEYTYVVRADDPSQVEDDTLQVLAKGLEQQIAEPGELPELLRRLPTEGLVPGSSRYFHGKFALDTIWFESENVLQVSNLTDGAAASYSAPEGTLLLIAYPPQAKPEAALDAWSKLANAKDDGAGHWLAADGQSGAMLIDGRLALALDCRAKDDVVTLLERLKASAGDAAQGWPED